MQDAVKLLLYAALSYQIAAGGSKRYAAFHSLPSVCGLKLLLYAALSYQIAAGVSERYAAFHSLPCRPYAPRGHSRHWYSKYIYIYIYIYMYVCSPLMCHI